MACNARAGSGQPAGAATCLMLLLVSALVARGCIETYGTNPEGERQCSLTGLRRRRHP